MHTLRLVSCWTIHDVNFASKTVLPGQGCRERERCRVCMRKVNYCLLVFKDKRACIPPQSASSRLFWLHYIYRGVRELEVATPAYFGEFRLTFYAPWL